MTDSRSSGGIGFAGLLTIVLITLKLLGKITWSWWWVLWPVWATAIMIVLQIILAIVLLVVARRKRKIN